MYGKPIDSIGFVSQFDPEIGAMMGRELGRQQDGIELIASENFASPAVIAAMGSILTNKYAEGLPGKRYYGGCQFVDELEQLCIDRAMALFGAEFANVQPHSGAQANTAVYAALLTPGDTIMGLDLSHGGHLTHGSKASISGRWFNAVFYGVNKDTEVIDYEEARRIALETKPKIIVCGASAYPRIIDFPKLKEIADEVGAYLMADIAHISGLVATGLHPSPVGYADIVTTTTHKTLRGPRGGLIMTNDPDLAKKINSGVFPRTQGGPLEHVIAAKAVCFHEALSPEFKTYQEQVLKNAQALAKSLQDGGVRLVSGGTDNHLLLADLRPLNITGAELQHRLDENYITVNKNAIPNDPQKPSVTSGVRIGTPAATTRGMKEEDMDVIAQCIYDTAVDFEGTQSKVRSTVEALTAKYPIYE